MSAEATSAPSWLFSFVDLAFLLLIAMTQIADPHALELGEIIVPRLDEKASENLPVAAAEAWQVRVHPFSESDPAFEVRHTAADGALDATPRMDLDGLRVHLAEVQQAGGSKPLLAPHADSRSQDMLDAVSAIEELWPGRRRATVARLAAAGR